MMSHSGPRTSLTAQSLLLLPHFPASRHGSVPSLNPGATSLSTLTLVSFTALNSIYMLLNSSIYLQTAISDCCLDTSTGVSTRLLKLKRSKTKLLVSLHTCFYSLPLPSYRDPSPLKVAHASNLATTLDSFLLLSPHNQSVNISHLLYLYLYLYWIHLYLDSNPFSSLHWSMSTAPGLLQCP